VIVLLTILIAGAAFGAVLWPLYRQPLSIPALADSRIKELEELLERKALMYCSIREIDFDLAMGKLSLEDHRRIRGEAITEAARVVGEIDRLLE